MISNCGRPTEKTYEFVNFHLKSILQSWWSSIRDSSDFINKVNSLKNISSNSIRVTIYAVGVYPSIPHESDLSTIKETLDNRKKKSVPIEDILKMLEFVSKKITLNSMEKSKNSCQVQLLRLNVHRLMHVYL